MLCPDQIFYVPFLGEPRMTLRYLKTLQAKESLRIQQEVSFAW